MHFLLCLLHVSCKDQAHGIFSHTADYSRSILLQNIISFSKAHPDATYIYLFWQGIFIKGTDACLDDGPHIIDGLCFSIGSQYSHNGVGIVRPAWIAFRQIISHRLFSFPLQLLFQFSRNHDMNVINAAIPRKVYAALAGGHSYIPFKESSSLLLIFLMPAL